MRPFPSPLMVAALFALSAVACQKPAEPAAPVPPAKVQVAPVPAVPSPSDPIQKAVYAYLQEVRQLDLTKMSVEVKNQKMEGDRASCEVSFSLREGGMPPMEYTYELAKDGEGWKVTSSKSLTGAHAGTTPPGGQVPPGHPAMGGAPAGMPAHGGPGVEPAMPPGHPPIDARPADAPATAK
jgi:hypothetical protein